MASIKTLEEQKFKITVSNGYHADGRKICKSKTILVPRTVQRRGIRQYVMHEAEELERTFRCGYAEDASMTFEEYARRWLTRQTHYHAATLAGYAAMLKVACESIGGIPLGKIRPLSIEHLLEVLRCRPRKQGGTLSENTVQKYLSSVAVVLEDARRNEIIPHNPARMVRLPRCEKTVQAIPTVEEMRLFLAEVDALPKVYATFYLLDIVTGARRGELCALTWADIGEQSIVISKSRGHVAGRGLVTGPTKNGRERVVANTPGMMRRLDALRRGKHLYSITAASPA